MMLVIGPGFTVVGKIYKINKFDPFSNFYKKIKNLIKYKDHVYTKNKMK